MKTILCAIFFVGAAVRLPAADINPKPPSEIRRHFGITGPTGNVLYEVTEIIRVSDTVDSSYLLVRDEGHNDLVMRNAWTFADQKVVSRISDVKDRTFVQVSYTMPFQSKTRLKTLEEARTNRQLQQLPSILRFETNGGEWAGVETDWDEHVQIRRLRHDMRQTIDFSLLESIERMRGTLLSTPDGEKFFPLLVRFIVYDSGTDSAQEGLKTRDEKPDCGFDASFGYPCSEKQKERVAKAAKSDTLLKRY